MGLIRGMKAIPKAITRATGKTLFKAKKASPQILVGVGITIAGASFVWAILNARKMDATMASSEEKVSEIEARKTIVEEDDQISDPDKAAQLKDIQKELNKARAEAAWKMFLLLGMPSLTFAGGIAMTIGGHRILVKRFGQLSVSFAALKESYDRYRMQVIADHGEQYDRNVRYGVVGETETTAEITDENGKTKTVKCKVPIVDKDGAASLYTFEFSQHTSRKCPKDPVNMISFLQGQQKFWNIWMETTGKPVTLAMVLNDLGIDLDPDDPMNDYILIAGWRPNGEGDNQIDFGILRAVNKPAIDNLENVCFLEFNCDGNIYHSARYLKDGRKVEA